LGNIISISLGDNGQLSRYLVSWGVSLAQNGAQSLEPVKVRQVLEEKCQKQGMANVEVDAINLVYRAGDDGAVVPTYVMQGKAVIDGQSCPVEMVVP